MFKFLKDLFKVPTPKCKPKLQTFNVPIIPDNFEVKYEFNNVKVAGVKYANPNKDKLKNDEEVQLIFEKKNKYDKNAIKIMQNNMKLGYISKNSTLQGLIHKFNKNKGIIVATLKRINAKSLSLNVKLYDSIENKYVSNKINLTSFKKSYRTNWDIVEDKQFLRAIYDCDINKYVVINSYGENLVDLNKNLTKELDNSKDIFCYFDDIDYDYDDNNNKIVESAELVITCIE